MAGSGRGSVQVVKAAEKERRKEKQPIAALAAKPFPPFRKPGGAEETWEAAAGGGIRTGPGGVHRSAPAGRPAVFSQAPALLDDHAARACFSALRIRRGMEELNTRWEQEGLKPLNVRIGIHSDAVLVGNIGSKERMSYTVMGDGVNVAARLEGINKE